MRGRRRAAVLLGCVLAVAAPACATDDVGSPPPTSRPPLDSPPDPGPPPLTDGFDDATRARLAESTVRVSGIACGRSSEGSGVAIADHLVVTNAHVLLGVDEPVVDRVDGTRDEATVVAFDPIDDLALLDVAGPAFVPLPLGDAPDGTIGALFGWEPGPAVDPTPFRIDRPVTVRIEAVGSDERIERASWLVAAEIESGDSGGALISTRGEVVGIAYATTTRGASAGYAVRAERVAALTDAGFDANLVVPAC